MINYLICLILVAHYVTAQVIPPPNCTIKFSHDEEDLDTPEYTTELLEPNVYFINSTGAGELDYDPEPGIDIRNRTNKPKPNHSEADPPYVSFRCSSEYVTDFSFSGVEGLSLVQVTRKRDVIKFVANNGSVMQILYVEVILTNNATGQYVFSSKDDPTRATIYYIFANTQASPSLLGQGRTLSGIYTDKKDRVLIPCVSPNPKLQINLWKVESNTEHFAIPVDGKTVKYDRKYGFTIIRDWKSKRTITGRFACTSPDMLGEVKVVVNEKTASTNPGNLTIHMLRNGVAECYGPIGSNVRFYTIDVNYDEAQVLVQCFMNKETCGHDYHSVEVGSPVVDEAGAVSAQLLDLSEKSGHLYCFSGDAVVHNHYYKALDGNYYLFGEPNHGEILRIVFSPDPQNGIFSSGASVSVGSVAASGLFVDEPRLYYGKYKNGTVSYMGYTTEQKSFFKEVFHRDLVQIIVNDQFLQTGDLINLSREVKTRRTTCGKRQFQCASDECILESQRCDHVVNCADGVSDEINCSVFKRNCTQSETMCASGQCIPSSDWCNNQTNCIDNSDEDQCKNLCEKDQFQCSNGDCIPNTYVCDGDKDCIDGSEEDSAVCSNCNGDPTKFKCKSGGCIQHDRICDGFKNCQDGSDEDSEACSLFAPKIINTGEAYTFGTDEDHYLVCEVKVPLSNSPKFTPFVRWETSLKRQRVPKGISKKKTQLITKLVPTVRSNDSEITYFVHPLPSFDVWDEGDYTCVAFNSVGESRKTFTVLTPACEPTPVAPPKPEKPHQNGSQTLGSKVVCHRAGKFRDPKNCSSFHECIAVGNKFIRHKYNCGHGTVYCPNEERCGWEHDCPCDKEPLVPQTPESEEVEDEDEESKKKQNVSHNHQQKLKYKPKIAQYIP